MNDTDVPAAPLLSARRFGLRTLLALLAGVLLVTLMSMTVIDVVGRYVFNAPLRGAAELTELLLASVIFLGLPAVSLADEHVTVDLVTDRMPAWIQPWRKALTGVFSAAVLCVVAWRIWVYAGQIGSYGGSTSTLHIPLAPVGYFCAACTLFGALLTLVVPLVRLAARRDGPNLNAEG
ncbi:TRAP transporter small permease [Marinibacterium sp. SX1]|uniref:TRAP transporter small permease n=1 Tax=Marinibacterium sp. SX1 TaxID=3388424 RepID=UPI003D1763EA